LGKKERQNKEAEKGEGKKGRGNAVGGCESDGGLEEKHKVRSTCAIEVSY